MSSLIDLGNKYGFNKTYFQNPNGTMKKSIEDVYNNYDKYNELVGAHKGIFNQLAGYIPYDEHDELINNMKNYTAQAKENKKRKKNDNPKERLLNDFGTHNITLLSTQITTRFIEDIENMYKVELQKLQELVNKSETKNTKLQKLVDKSEEKTEILSEENEILRDENERLTTNTDNFHSIFEDNAIRNKNKIDRLELIIKQHNESCTCINYNEE